MALLPGHRIGVYHIPGLLGVGGWGEVQVFGLEPHGNNRAIARGRMDARTPTDAIGRRKSARVLGKGAPASP